MKIGIFDSGLGGLLVFRRIREVLPEFDYVYLGDTKRVPYGNRSQETIYSFTTQALRYLFSRDVKLVILACNTASARALRKIQQEFLPKEFPDRNVLGVIIPTVEEAVENRSHRIGIIGTQSTIDSDTYRLEIQKRDPSIEVVQKATPLFVPIIEHDDVHLLTEALHEYLLPLQGENLDSLLLGCTHYGLIRDEIQDVIGKNIKIVAQEDVVPNKLHEYLSRHHDIESSLTKKGTHELLVTDITKHMAQRASEWFPENEQLTCVTIES